MVYVAQSTTLKSERMVKMAEKISPAKKYSVYAAAIATANSVVDNNYNKGNYKDMPAFPLGAAYVYATNARGKILQAFKDAKFFTSYEKGVQKRMPSGQSANIGTAMADDWIDAFYGYLTYAGMLEDNKVELTSGSWLN